VIGGDSAFESVVKSNPKDNLGLSAADWIRLTNRIRSICNHDRYLRYDAEDWTQNIVTAVLNNLSRAQIHNFEQAYHYALGVLKRKRFEALREKIKGEKIDSIDQDSEESSHGSKLIEQLTVNETPATEYERKRTEGSFKDMLLALQDCVAFAATLLTDEKLKLLADYHQSAFYDGDWTEHLAQKEGITAGTLYTRISRALNKLTNDTLECMKSKDYELPMELPQQEVKDYLISYINKIQEGDRTNES
jgi:DNA-directed RNA polymerase specialized sigma24 family protein